MKQQTKTLSSPTAALTVGKTTSIEASVVNKALGKVVVFGASGGVGQQICSKLVQSGQFIVTAVTRDVERVNNQLFPLLDDCKIEYADARKIDTLGSVLEDAKHVVISVGRLINRIDR